MQTINNSLEVNKELNILWVALCSDVPPYSLSSNKFVSRENKLLSTDNFIVRETSTILVVYVFYSAELGCTSVLQVCPPHVRVSIQERSVVPWIGCYFGSTSRKTIYLACPLNDCQ